MTRASTPADPHPAGIVQHDDCPEPTTEATWIHVIRKDPRRGHPRLRARNQGRSREDGLARPTRRRRGARAEQPHQLRLRQRACPLALSRAPGDRDDTGPPEHTDGSGTSGADPSGPHELGPERTRRDARQYAATATVDPCRTRRRRDDRLAECPGQRPRHRRTGLKPRLTEIEDISKAKCKCFSGARRPPPAIVAKRRHPGIDDLQSSSSIRPNPPPNLITLHR